ncbi:MAG TPA: HDOD domain-containing protein [Tepidisphaeraceae bacterium]|nr:HDOD domain-containing protein [Tepidisphaeraceae bacterium]
MPTLTPLIPGDPQTIAHDLLRRVTSLATLPEVTVRIIQIVEDPRSTAARLHQTISHDPALVTRILKVVNSAFYGLPGQVTTAERAVVLLGVNAVKNLALAASLGQLFKGIKICDAFSPRDLWTHCVAVGVIAREMAKQLRLPVVDEAFLGGMIHDMGLLVHLQVHPEKLSQTCRAAQKEGIEFLAAERNCIGIDHQMLGMALSDHWHFPRAFGAVAGFHHHPDGIQDESRQLVSLIHVADTILCHQSGGFNLTAVRQEIHEQALADLGIDRETAEQMVKGMGQRVKEAIQLFA